jgi:hypothetical protein
LGSSEYIRETEHALRQLFDGVAYYRKLLQEINHPMFITDAPIGDENEYKAEFSRWCNDNKEAIQNSHRKSQEYFGLSFSNATLCGSILQIASMGIDLFSLNNEIPDPCKTIVKEGKKAVKFCVGRIVRGLPLGIIIYAARNQYNHWDDPNPHKIAQKVFDALALNHGYGSVRDPAFDLSSRNLKIYSHNVIALLEWKSYESYLTDIKTII